MENNQPIVAVAKEKDYWNFAYKNFFQIACLGAFIFVLTLVLYLTKSGPYQAFGVVTIVQVGVFTVLWFITSQLFKKHKKSAIPVAYVFLAIIAAAALYPNVNIIGLIITAYLFWCVYKASKHPATMSQLKP